jgi:uncharacterized protein YkwD
LRVLTRGLPMPTVRGDGARRRVAVAVGFIALTSAFLAGAGERGEARAGVCPHAHESPAHSRQFIKAILCLQDAERHRHGMGSLRAHGALRRAAARHARDMVRRHYFGHFSLSGTSPVGRALASGYRNARKIDVRENILTWPSPLTPAEAMEKWMASPPHRGAILRPGSRDVGIALANGCTSGAGGLTLVVEFGRKYR